MTASSPPKPGPKPVRESPPARRAEGSSKRDVPVAELRLFIGREGLGIELAETARIGCVDVTEIAVNVAGVKFPLDVSGGVGKFRHKRGKLSRLAVELRAYELAAWAAPRLRGVLGPKTPDVWVLPHRDGATIAVSEREDVNDEVVRPRVVAFEIAIATDGEDVRLTVHDARGCDLHGPATAVAIAAVVAVLGAHAEREGASFTMAHCASRIARMLLPDAGVRAPSTDGVVWSSVAADRDAWILHASLGGVAATASDTSIRARELAQIVRQGDDARVRGDYDAARALDLVALERAPRHREISRRIAEIDAIAGGRAEAALAVLAEASGAATARDGVLLAELHAEAGDMAAAYGSFARAAASEEAPALAARAYERAAALVDDDADALDWLDRAVARAPRVGRIRWSRITRRLAAGRLEDALADVEHLEAQAVGPRAKHLVWRRAGAAWREAGARADAATLFERALRFVPDEPESLAGLGAALVAEGRSARGVALLTRALELAEERALPSSAMVVELARALAERLDDRSSAIARLRSVPESAPEAVAARGLEARYRAELGDVTGASLAFARMRELAAVRADGDTTADAVLPFLIEAAMFEREARDDLLAAQRHLAVALRLRPKHAKALTMYRSVGEAIAKPPPQARVVLPVPSAPDSDHAEVEDEDWPEADEAAAPASTDAKRVFSLDDTDAPGEDDAVAAARVEDLTRRLQIDPSNDAVVDELGSLLAQLGRSHELLALLSARLEDATPERREELRAPTRLVLENLERDAVAAGRDGEAAIYRDAVSLFGL